MNTSGYGRVVSSALLRSALKRLRQASGQQQAKVAEALDWPVSKIMRIESGSDSPLTTDLRALLRYYQVADQARVDELVVLCRAARVPGWWDRFNVQDRAFALYVGYEAGAASIRAVQGVLIPGILQTEAYARLMTRTYASPEYADSIVRLRLERQDDVIARAPEQHYILDEAVLRRQVGDVMPRQLRHLIELAGRPGTTIRVIPFSAGPHFGMRGPFVLLGFDVPLDQVLFLESARRGDLIASEEGIVADGSALGADHAAATIAAYEDGFATLQNIALDPAESASLIERIAHEAS